MVIIMYLIVGLGNPGREYEKTRHNAGFQVIDKLCSKWNISLNKEDFHGAYIKTKFNNEDVIICKPYTFMNLSGQTVMEIAHFYKIDIENIVVIYDDMDTPVGNLRIKLNGSSGGQKGMQSIIQMMHTENIKRIKIGIGRPSIPVIDYVLTTPNKDDQEKISEAQNRAVIIIEEYIKRDFNYVLSRYNK